MQQVIPAETAGFCFGVDRAVNMAYKAASECSSCCSLGPIIHNTDVINDLESKGVRVIESPADTEPGETVIIRAHGVTPDVLAQVRNHGGVITDATCPFVQKIHDIVSENSSPDVPVLIAGDENHPEVIGIRGCCKGESYVFSSCEEAEKILSEHKELASEEVIIVSQTTFSESEWKICKEKIKFYCTNPKIFDTICSATRKRQEEAASLSSSCDAMIVIGGRHSSNTVKLKSVCSENCDTFLVERASELKNIDFSTYARVGVTAGASTPSAIIKEVLLAMSENINENANIQVEEVPSDFASMISDFNDDNIVKCIVESISGTEIHVSLPGNHRLGGYTGIVTEENYSSDPNADPAKELNVGDEITLKILKGNDVDGIVMLSKKILDADKSWNQIVAAKEDGTILTGVVTDIVKGGVLASCNGSRVFIPASQATEHRDDNIEDLLKKNVEFRIIDVDLGRKRAVGSIRAVAGEKKKAAAEAFWAAAEEGKSYTGVVKSLTNYGAFVDIGGIDGMVHISEMSWKRIKHPSEIFTVGQEVEVYIKSLDRENKKISLGYRKDEDNPWAILKKDYPEGTTVEAEIVGLTTFGAFAKVIPGIDGLIHISQIADRRINKPEEVLTVGEKVKCKITAIDYDKKRVSLSIRALIAPEADEAAEDEAAEDEATAEEAPAEDTAE